MPQNIITPLRPVDCLYNGRVKIFDDFVKYTVFSKAVFNPHGFEKVKSDIQVENRKYDTSNETRSDSVKRAIDKAFEIAYANDFKYFVTFTLDKDKIDRYEPKEILKKLKVWLSNNVSRKGFKYIIFPEYHSLKDGEEKPSIHFHGLLSGDLKLVDSGYRTERGQIIYNSERWSFGFSTVIEIDGEKNKLVNYVMKYITKDKKKIFGKFYFSGGHIEREVPTQYFNEDFMSFDGAEYKIANAPLSVKYRTDLGEDNYEKVT